jgi:hypothetical protein
VQEFGGRTDACDLASGGFEAGGHELFRLFVEPGLDLTRLLVWLDVQMVDVRLTAASHVMRACN